MRLTLQGLAFVAGLLLALGGCTVSVNDQGNSSGAGGGGNSGQGGSGTSSSAQAGTGGDGGATSGGMSTGGAGGAGGGAACGGFAGTQCGPTEYCDFPDDICGGDDGLGVCTPRPGGCPEFYSPTCACGGKVYGNPCDANMSGFDVSNLSGCMPPAKGMFGCGHTFCDAATQYCIKTLADVPGTADSYTCAALPMGCGSTPSCDCLPDACGAPIPGNCMPAQDGGLILTCPGG